MTPSQTPPARLRHYFTALVLLAELAHLAWEHLNGGVISHHLLARADMPAISNWWGVLLLPALTWFLTGRSLSRIAAAPGKKLAASKLPVSVVAGFLGALLLGVALSAAFTNGQETMSSLLFGAMFVLAVLLPAYRAECVLGFVLGMTFTFGAVLPTVVGAVIAAVSALVHLGVRPMLARLWGRFRRTRPATA